MSLKRVISPDPQEWGSSSRDKIIGWNDTQRISRNTTYRLQLNGQHKNADLKVARLPSWVCVDVGTHTVLLKERDWKDLSGDDHSLLVEAIKNESVRSFGMRTPEVTQAMRRQFLADADVIESVAAQAFMALRYAAKRSESRSSKLYQQIGAVRYKIEYHLGERGSSQLFFIGGELDADGSQTIACKAVIIDIPKQSRGQRTAQECVCYKRRKAVVEEARMLAAKTRLDALKNERKDPHRVADVAEEVEMWHQRIIACKLLRGKAIARGVKNGALLAARGIPNVLKYVGQEIKEGRVVKTFAEMCEGDARVLIPKPHERLSLVEQRRRLDILKDIVDALIPLHKPPRAFRLRSVSPVLCVCDLKTANVFLKSGHAKLGDLSGIVKEGEPVCEFSPGYAAPGKDEGSLARHEDDIYALGLIGYELLHGRFTTAEEAYTLLNARDPIDRLLMDMLEKDRLQRLSALVVRARLESLTPEVIRLADGAACSSSARGDSGVDVTMSAVARTEQLPEAAPQIYCAAAPTTVEAARAPAFQINPEQADVELPSCSHECVQYEPEPPQQPRQLPRIPSRASPRSHHRVIPSVPAQSTHQSDSPRHSSASTPRRAAPILHRSPPVTHRSLSGQRSSPKTRRQQFGKNS